MNEIVKTDDKPRAVAQATNAGGLLNIIAEAAKDPSFDLARMERLFSMQREIVAEEAKRAYATAMATVQAEMMPVVRDAQNTHTNSRYARLEAIDAVIRPVYTKHGFSLSFRNDDAENAVTVTCIVTHSGGHSEQFPMTGALDGVGSQGRANKTPIQARGSTTQYLRRYTTCGAFNVTLRDEDNDGNAQNKAHLLHIDETQKSQILALIKVLADAGSETASFYAFIKDQMGAEAVDDLKVSDYPRVMTALKNKIKAVGTES